MSKKDTHRPRLGAVCAPGAMAFSFYRRPILERKSIVSLSSWLRNLRAAGHSRPAGRSRPASRFRPRLEALEDRAVLHNVALLGADLFNDHGSVTVNDSIIGDW
jgi:hypothetical protein